MKSEMTAAAVIDLLQLLESAAIEVWLDGGWAVEKDVRDMELLQARFGVALPAHLRRQA